MPRASFLLCALLLAVSARADHPEEREERAWREPLSNRNLFPLSLLFLDLAPQRADAKRRGEFELTFNFGYSNIVALQKEEAENIVLDLEYLATEVRFETGLGRGFEVGASLPFYSMYGGFLDPFISGFHSAFNLPNFVRGQRENHLFEFGYERLDERVLFRESGGTGLGDLTLQLKKELAPATFGHFEVAVRAAVKLPTGSRARLTSFETTDFAVGLLTNGLWSRFGAYFNVGYVFLGDVDLVRTRDFLSLMAAFDWRFKPRLAAVLQFEQFGEQLTSDLRVLSQPGRQVIVGLRFRQSKRFHYEWRFSEDLSSTSPDFTLGFQMQMSWETARRRKD